MGIKSWIINNHCVEFIEDDHLYLVDGILTASVTEILKSKFNDYAFVSRAVLEQASARGTELHKAIETYETTGQTSDLKEFHNYLFLKNRIGFTNISNELPVIYEEDGKVLFAGQLDQIIVIDGEFGINDFKRVSAPNKEKIAYQLNLYKIAYEQSYHQQIKSLSFMQLREDVRRFTPLPINEQQAKDLLKNYYQEI